jgi:prolyl oligopeptidase
MSTSPNHDPERVRRENGLWCALVRTAIAAVLLGCSTAKSPSAPAPARDAAKPMPPAFVYPAARRGDVVETHHGVKVADPYRWLEQMDSGETRAWVTAENALTDGYLAEIGGRDALRARIEALVRYESFRAPFLRGGRYFWLYRDGRANQPVVSTAASLEGPTSTLFDPNRISADGSLAFAGISVSEDGAHFAYGLSIGGGDWESWHVRDVASGADLRDELPDIKYYAPAFTRDGKALYYSRFPAPQPGKELVETDHDCKVYVHEVGASVADDVVVYERPDHPTWQYDVEATRDGRYLVITIGDGQVGDRGQEQIAYLDLEKGGAKPVSLIDTYKAEYLFVGNDGPLFYFKTTDGAANKRIIAIDVRRPARDHWKEVVGEGANAIAQATLVGHQIFVTTLRDAHAAVAAYDLRGRKVRDIALPGLGSVDGFRGGPEDRETFYTYASFVVPNAVYRYDIATGTSKLWKSPTVAFDSTAFETKQVFFPSKDGTKVPMFVTAKKGLALDGTNPTIVTGYGFGGIPSTPSFDPAMVAWLERGGVLVLVNIRGGGEYGEAWHKAATRTHRQVAFDDFISAGEWLVANKVTSPRHLGAMGTSGGGMLVGAVTIERPDLFAATVPIAGVLDLLRFQLFGQGAGWQGDMGSPEDPSEFAALYAISPLHNVRAGTRYPAILVVTSDHDVRVAPLHSYKFAAALQAAQGGPGRILLRVETESGHGGGSTISQKIDQGTQILGFLARNLGLSMN